MAAPRSPQGRAVLAALGELDHPTADDVFQHVRERLPRVSLATVYRNLEQFVQDGDVRLRDVGGRKRYDINTRPHAHLHCTQCDGLVDVQLQDTVTDGLADVARRHGLAYQEALVELRGTCPDCKEEKT